MKAVVCGWCGTVAKVDEDQIRSWAEVSYNSLTYDFCGKCSSRVLRLISGDYSQALHTMKRLLAYQSVGGEE